MNMSFDSFFLSLKDKTIAVIGLGISNRPLVRLLLQYGCRVIGCDRTERSDLDRDVLELESSGAELHLGQNYLQDIYPDLVFRTPGMHPDHPALAGFREHNVPITSEMEIFFELCPCHIIAVTGSDGKTTTTTLVSKFLKADGKTVWLGGNIGHPLLSHIPDMKPSDYAVVELSSFQLMDMKRSAERCVITNLAPNHLDVHKDMQEYIDAKKNVFLYQSHNGLLVVNGDNNITAPMKGNGKTCYFSRQSQPEYGVYLDNGTIYQTEQGIRKAIITTEDILLPGVHNIENYMAAIAVTNGLVSSDSILKVARSFGGVEHRIELVREKDQVRYYNDSIASSPTRTISGLRSFPQRVILIAGGYDKKIPYDVLGPEICAHVKKLFLTGDTAQKIYDAVVDCPDYQKGYPEIQMIDDFAETVRRAAKSAESGDVVLLSPASASFDRFKNFEVRGNYFKQLVMEL